MAVPPSVPMFGADLRTPFTTTVRDSRLSEKADARAPHSDGALHFDHGEAQARIEPPWPTPWPTPWWLEEALLETTVPGQIVYARGARPPCCGPDPRLSG